MKKSVVSLGLIGVFLLVSNLIFAQDVPPANWDNSAMINQAGSNNSDVTSAPTDTQANTDAAPTPNDVTSNEANANAILPADTQANTDETTPPEDTQANSDTTTPSPDQANTEATSAPADTQANAASQ